MRAAARALMSSRSYFRPDPPFAICVGSRTLSNNTEDFSSWQYKVSTSSLSPSSCSDSPLGQGKKNVREEKVQPLWLQSQRLHTTIGRAMFSQVGARESCLTRKGSFVEQRGHGFRSLAPDSSVPGLVGAVVTESSSQLRRARILSKHIFVQGYETASSSSSTTTGRPPEEIKPKKPGVIKQTLLDLGSVPFPALALGMAGLIPFVALAPPLASLLPLPETLYAVHTEAQAAYGACIVTFLGAVHWGLAMADYAAPGKSTVANISISTARYVWSVVPSLVAWTALLLPPASKFALIIVSLAMVLGVDILSARMRLVPSWYLALRWPLTAVATLSMTTSLLVATALAQV